LPGRFITPNSAPNNRIEADHGRLEARLSPMRGLKRDRSCRGIIAGNAFIDNPGRHHYQLGTYTASQLTVVAAFTELARDL
jgi:transposase, IS6 family